MATLGKLRRTWEQIAQELCNQEDPEECLRLVDELKQALRREYDFLQTVNLVKP